MISTDHLDALQANASARLRAALDAPATVPDRAAAGTRSGSRSRSTARVTAMAALVLLVVAAVVITLVGFDRDRQVVRTGGAPGSTLAQTTTSPLTRPDTNGPGAQLLIEQYDSLVMSSPRAEGAEAPPIVAPLQLPDGWKFLGLGASTSPGASSLSLDFVRPIDGNGKFPAVSVCVTSDDLCRPGDGRSLPSAPISVDGLAGAARIYGEPSALEAWNGIPWTTDLSRLTW